MVEKRIEGTTFKRRPQAEHDQYIEMSIEMEEKWVETSQEKFKWTKDERKNILRVIDELIKVSARTWTSLTLQVLGIPPKEFTEFALREKRSMKQESVVLTGYVQLCLRLS